MREEAGLFDGEVEVMISDPAENERMVTRIMAKLIDADKRIAEIKKIYCDGCDNYGGVKCLDCWVDDAMCLIDDAPSVDAVEVVHGYTIPAEEPKKVLLDRKCGICDQLMLSTDVFCPMCGAKMDGNMENNRPAEVIR